MKGRKAMALTHRPVPLAIVGGGAAGLFAASVASSRGVGCLVLERKARIGSKMLMTANGRCNFTKDITPERMLADILTPEKLQQYQKAQGEIGAALGRLLAITENYPELKANENFKELQAQLEGTENRISVERRNFNEVARSYNTSIRTFPKTIIASICGFDKRPYFEAEEGANKAPEVKF